MHLFWCLQFALNVMAVTQLAMWSPPQSYRGTNGSVPCLQKIGPSSEVWGEWGCREVYFMGSDVSCTV